ncbi:MAG: SpoIIE family protein phosphatase [Candidatus Aegiribacteria sp.]|nr:SpoIIE family protein phosphatase [Candidatus Aegiribacteria sp.]MBD3294645.1 SpoIIE family protein phosphatase [Candidatus Fermentibacteria bacterium]
MTDSKGFKADILWKILDVTRQLSTTIELDDMLADVVNVARDVLGAERGSVFLYDTDSNELFAEVGTGLEVHEIRFPADQGIAGICVRTGRIVNVPDAYAHEGFNPEIDRKMGYRTRCILSVPLVGLDGNLVGVLQLINKIDGTFSSEDERIAQVLGSHCAVALQRARLLEEFLAKQQMEHDLELAREIQRALLPELMPQVDGYDLAGWNRPADRTGGDMFDAVSTDGRKVLLILADASGHGIGPALSVTQFRAMIRMAFRMDSELSELHTHTNNQLVEDLTSERFITSFVGVLDTGSNIISYHACGQAPLLHYRSGSGEVEVLAASALPFGIMPDIPLEDPGPVKMAKGDIFALISDGILEQENAQGEQFGTERAAQLLRESSFCTMKELADRFREAVTDHSEKTSQDDDMTIVLVKRTD